LAAADSSTTRCCAGSFCASGVWRLHRCRPGGDFVPIAQAAGAQFGNMQNAWWAEILFEAGYPQLGRADERVRSARRLDAASQPFWPALHQREVRLQRALAGAFRVGRAGVRSTVSCSPSWCTTSAPRGSLPAVSAAPEPHPTWSAVRISKHWQRAVSAPGAGLPAQRWFDLDADFAGNLPPACAFQHAGA